MRINFVLPTLNMSGGVKVVMQYCTYLNNNGHDCVIYYPLKEYLKHGLIKPEYRYTHAVPHTIPTALFGIRDADATIATSWDTAKLVLSLPKPCGEKVYFIQHYETIWDGRAYDTYKYKMKQIVVSKWLYNLFHNTWGLNPIIVENGVRMPVIYKSTGADGEPLEILMPYRNENWKGSKDGLSVLCRVHLNYPDIILKVFGFNVTSENIPDYIEIHNNPTDEQVEQLYYDADIFLCPSHSEGFGLPALEAMSYMCAVVTTNVGAVPEYTDHGKYAKGVEPHDKIEMYKAVAHLIDDHKERIGYQVLGRMFVERKYTLEGAGKRFEECLRSLVQ